MPIKSALQKGFQLIFRNALAIVVFYLVNIILVAMLAIPLFSEMYRNLGDKSASSSMLAGFDTEWADSFAQSGSELARSLRVSVSGPGMFLDNLEFFIHGAIRSYGWLILGLGLLYITLNALMLGGLIGIFGEEKRKFSIGRFFHLAGSYFNRFFSITATAALVYLLFYKLAILPLIRVFEALGNTFLSERAAVLTSWIGALLAFFILTLLNIIFDYGRIAVIKENKQSAWEAIWIGLKFIFRHFGQVLGIYYVLVAITVLLTLVFAGLFSSISQTGLLLIILAFLLQQVFIVVKIWLRLNFYGCQYEFYRGISEMALPRKKKL